MHTKIVPTYLQVGTLFNLFPEKLDSYFLFYSRITKKDSFAEVTIRRDYFHRQSHPPNIEVRAVRTFAPRSSYLCRMQRFQWRLIVYTSG